VSKGIVRRETSKRQGRSDGLFKTPGIAQCPNQSVMRLEIFGIGGNGSTKTLDCAASIVRRKQIQPLLCMGFSGVFIRLDHVIL